MFVRRVADLVTRAPVTCGPDTSAAEVARTIRHVQGGLRARYGTDLLG